MDVTILLGSSSDLPVAQKCTKILEQFDVPYQLRVASAHRSPKFVEQIVGDAIDDGCSVFIAMAGLAAALPGAVAALTTKPVIGVPCGGRVPYDSLLSIAQLPPGVPAATVGVDRGDNAGYLAVQMLALSNAKYAAALEQNKLDQIDRASRPRTRKSTAVPEMFDAEEFIAESIESLKASIDDVAIIACSGGVDSTVAAVIANKAVGNLLHCVYVDTGFMRKNETEQIEALLEEQGINLITVKAADRYFEALKGVTEPEQKRKVIGELFIRIFEDEQKKCGAKYLVQGTIAPDWIESGGGVRDTIKSHHNVGGLPEDMTLQVVEPLRELYKDEVRELARKLDINVAERQPFPGPGLAVRTLGELTPERVAVVREACAIVEEEFEAAAERGEMDLPWQYFAALLPVRSVGVHGDVRAYGETIVVRAVQSMDGMSARYSEIPHKTLQKISTRITNTVKGAVNRVVYDITHKPPGTIEWE